MFLTKEAVRLTVRAVATGVACEGCPSIPDLVTRYVDAGGEFLVCPVCFNARRLDDSTLIEGARLGGSVQLWEWIADGATTFSY